MKHWLEQMLKWFQKCKRYNEICILILYVNQEPSIALQAPWTPACSKKWVTNSTCWIEELCSLWPCAPYGVHDLWRCEHNLCRIGPRDKPVLCLFSAWFFPWAGRWTSDSHWQLFWCSWSSIQVCSRWAWSFTSAWVSLRQAGTLNTQQTHPHSMWFVLAFPLLSGWTSTALKLAVGPPSSCGSKGTSGSWCICLSSSLKCTVWSLVYYNSFWPTIWLQMRLKPGQITTGAQECSLINFWTL